MENLLKVIFSRISQPLFGGYTQVCSCCNEFSLARLESFNSLFISCFGGQSD
jgi:hypothetical protein